MLDLADTLRTGTWKTEVAPEWSYQAGLKGGWIPNPPNKYQYPRICG